MKEIILFDTREESVTEKTERHGTWVPLHTDIEGDKIKVTFVNGTDDTTNSDESVKRHENFQRRNELKQKQKDSDLSIQELNEYMRLV